MAMAIWALGSACLLVLFLMNEVRWHRALADQRVKKADYRPLGVSPLALIRASWEEGRELGGRQGDAALESRRRAVLWSLGLFALFAFFGYPVGAAVAALLP